MSKKEVAIICCIRSDITDDASFSTHSSCLSSWLAPSSILFHSFLGELPSYPKFSFCELISRSWGGWEEEMENAESTTFLITDSIYFQDCSSYPQGTVSYLRKLSFKNVDNVLLIWSHIQIMSYWLSLANQILALGWWQHNGSPGLVSTPYNFVLFHRSELLNMSFYLSVYIFIRLSILIPKPGNSPLSCVFTWTGK
jgi:hypothetical protein